MVYNVYEDCSRRSNSMMKTRNSDYGGDGPRGTSPQLAINASSDTDKQHAGVITNDERVAIQYFNLDYNRRNEDSQTSSPSICEYVRTYILPLHHYQITPLPTGDRRCNGRWNGYKVMWKEGNLTKRNGRMRNGSIFPQTRFFLFSSFSLLFRPKHMISIIFRTLFD